MIKVNLEEILRSSFFHSGLSDEEWNLWFVTWGHRENVLRAMKEACRQVLELAAENYHKKNLFDEEWHLNIVKGAIKDTINQVNSTDI